MVFDSDSGSDSSPEVLTGCRRHRTELTAYQKNDSMWKKNNMWWESYCIKIPAAFTDMTPDDIRTMVEVNLTATMLLTRRVLPGMLDRGRGHIVFVSSGLAKMGSAYQAPYSATKAALLALTQALRAEYRHTPVGFSVVCPGLVTGAGMYQRMLDDGFSASPLLGTTTTTRVARKVVAAIRHDRPEVHVTGAPVRPIVAAIQLNPRLTEMITARAGMTELFRRVAAGRAETKKT